MKCNELIRESAWVVQDLLTKEECEYFLQRAKSLGIQDRIAAGDVRHRNSTTVSLDDKEMADRIFDRIKNHIPQEIVIDEHYQNPGLATKNDQLYGKWKPYGLNFRWRLVCYPGQGHFGPHRDGYHQVDEHHRSFITINGFLTDRPPGFGGATRFVKDEIDAVLNDDGIFSTSESDVLYRVEAEQAGTASVFFHELMHDGEPLKKGSPPKWLFRTEIMYQRDPESAPKATLTEIEARKYMALAEEAESKGEIIKAMSLYKRAYRLDPQLEDQ
mmetsp:Transcript_27343/g.66375  ORF Transcript_27343/g.66375 Transcript_27343/m.66375 type:complete len:272 (-) Transcript_27343:1564-2379(-)